jgi:hypothetical protein
MAGSPLRLNRQGDVSRVNSQEDSHGGYVVSLARRTWGGGNSVDNLTMSAISVDSIIFTAPPVGFLWRLGNMERLCGACTRCGLSCLQQSNFRY